MMAVWGFVVGAACGLAAISAVLMTLHAFDRLLSLKAKAWLSDQTVNMREPECVISGVGIMWMTFFTLLLGSICWLIHFDPLVIQFGGTVYVLSMNPKAYRCFFPPGARFVTNNLYKGVRQFAGMLLFIALCGCPITGHTPL